MYDKSTDVESKGVEADVSMACAALKTAGARNLSEIALVDREKLAAQVSPLLRSDWLQRLIKSLYPSYQLSAQASSGRLGDCLFSDWFWKSNLHWCARCVSANQTSRSPKTDWSHQIILLMAFKWRKWPSGKKRSHLSSDEVFWGRRSGSRCINYYSTRLTTPESLSSLCWGNSILFIFSFQLAIPSQCSTQVGNQLQSQYIQRMYIYTVFKSIIQPFMYVAAFPLTPTEFNYHWHYCSVHNGSSHASKTQDTTEEWQLCSAGFSFHWILTYQHWQTYRMH